MYAFIYLLVGFISASLIHRYGDLELDPEEFLMLIIACPISVPIGLFFLVINFSKIYLKWIKK